MGGKVCLRCKSKTLLVVVNKLLKTKSLLTSLSKVLPYQLTSSDQWVRYFLIHPLFWNIDVIYGWPLRRYLRTNLGQYDQCQCPNVWQKSLCQGCHFEKTSASVWGWWKKTWTQKSSPWKVPFIYYVSNFIAQDLIWLTNFSQKLGFVVTTKEFLFQHYILTNFSCFSLKFLVHKEEEKFFKILQLVKKCLCNTWMALKWKRWHEQVTFDQVSGRNWT